MGTNMTNVQPYEVVVIGASAGGIEALIHIFKALPADFPVPVVAIIHRKRDVKGQLSEVLGRSSALQVQDVEPDTRMEKGNIYIAPPDLHLRLNEHKTLALCNGEKVCFSRPSIDVLFESAAASMSDKVLGVLLTGSNADGAKGLYAIHQQGGYCIVQCPKDAQFYAMPEAALNRFTPDHVCELRLIPTHILAQFGYEGEN